MSKQLLIDALKGKRTSRAPWLPYAGINSAFLIDETAENYLKSPELMAKGVENAAKRYRADGIPLMFDLSVEANASGLRAALVGGQCAFSSLAPLFRDGIARQTGSQGPDQGIG